MTSFPTAIVAMALFCADSALAQSWILPDINDRTKAIAATPTYGETIDFINKKLLKNQQPVINRHEKAPKSDCWFQQFADGGIATFYYRSSLRFFDLGNIRIDKGGGITLNCSKEKCVSLDFKGFHSEKDHMSFGFQEEDMPQIAKAFAHALKICGASSSPELFK